MTMFMKAPALAALLFFSAAQVATADAPSPDGTWSRGDGKARVRIAPCGDDLCATNTWIKDGDTQEKVGDRLVMTVRQSGGTWSGRAFDPQRNLHYRLTMTVADKTMTTSGCMLGGLLCKHVSWTRLDAAG